MSKPKQKHRVDQPEPGAIERKTIGFEIKAVTGEGSGSFSGIGGAFHNVDCVGDIIVPGAFEEGLPDFLGTGFIGGLGHDWDRPIGHPAEAREIKEGLDLRAVFDASPQAQAARAQMTPHPDTGRATVNQLSIGFSTVKAEYLEDPKDVRAYWDSAGYIPTPTDVERSAKGVRLLQKIKLYEVSPVLKPANDLARITGVKGESPGFAETSRKVATIAREMSEEFGEFVRLADRRAGLRLKEGRVLSDANRKAMQDVLDEHLAVIDRHKAMCAQLGDILERTRPPSKSAEPPPVEAAVAAPAIDHDAITQRFIATFAALDGLA